MLNLKRISYVKQASAQLLIIGTIVGRHSRSVESVQPTTSAFTQRA